MSWKVSYPALVNADRIDCEIGRDDKGLWDIGMQWFLASRVDGHELDASYVHVAQTRTTRKSFATTTPKTSPPRARRTGHRNTYLMHEKANVE